MMIHRHVTRRYSAIPQYKGLRPLQLTGNDYGGEKLTLIWLVLQQAMKRGMIVVSLMNYTRNEVVRLRSQIAVTDSPQN